jgi:hypothetical protein
VWGLVPIKALYNINSVRHGESVARPTRRNAVCESRVSRDVQPVSVTVCLHSSEGISNISV